MVDKSQPGQHVFPHEREIDNLKTQLWKYGKHIAACPLWSRPNVRCTCGWAEVRATLAPIQQRPEDAANAAIAPILAGSARSGGAE